MEIFNSLYNPNNGQVLEGNSFEKFYSIEEALDYYKNCIVEFDCNILPEKGLEIVDFHELYKPKYSNINNGVNIAVILQFGHGTRNGGYVYGRDYINPAIRPVFDNIADAAWREVTRL